MDREEAVEKLWEYVTLGDYDQEVAHSRADDVLCNLLISLGYQDVVDVYNRVPKWYA